MSRPLLKCRFAGGVTGEAAVKRLERSESFRGMTEKFKMEIKNILFTGPPRCGKSTLIHKIVQKINIPATGFFTREIREKGRRVGFFINTLDQKEGVLAHERIKSRWRVGKYGVNLSDIDRIAVPSMMPATLDRLVVIDEIGKMECFSKLFKKTLEGVLDSDLPVIASIAMKGDRFIQNIKKRSDVQLIKVTPQNRDELENMYLKFNK